MRGLASALPEDIFLRPPGALTAADHLQPEAQSWPLVEAVEGGRLCPQHPAWGRSQATVVTESPWRVTLQMPQYCQGL